MIKLLHPANIGGRIIPAGTKISYLPADLVEKMIDAGTAEIVGEPVEEFDSPIAEDPESGDTAVEEAAEADAVGELESPIAEEPKSDPEPEEIQETGAEETQTEEPATPKTFGRRGKVADA